MHITEEHNPCLPYLRDKTSKLTEKPGCYIMKDSGGKIIYVGKAKNLKHRVTSYFRKGQDHLPKVWKMVSLVRDYDFIVTDSEFEALVLECSLIKQYSPKYNILLKDDKGYSYIRVSNEEYPRLTAALQKEDDGAQYIGPYISSYSVKQAVDEANRVFMLPTCTKQFPRDFGKSRPCLNCFIKQCMGVCKGEISAKDYRGVVQQAVEYIKSGSQASVERLTEQMNAAAEALDFEQAAKLRDRIAAIKKAAEGQKIVSDDLRDMDIFAVSENADRACGSVLMYRGGRLFDKYSAPLGMTDLGSAMREGFITEFYSARSEIPKDILLDEPIENTELLERYLSDKCGHRVHISVPQRGALLRLTTLAKSNASEHLSLRVDRTGKAVLRSDILAVDVKFGYAGALENELRGLADRRAEVGFTGKPRVALEKLGIGEKALFARGVILALARMRGGVGQSYGVVELRQHSPAFFIERQPPLARKVYTVCHMNKFTFIISHKSAVCKSDFISIIKK